MRFTSTYYAPHGNCYNQYFAQTQAGILSVIAICHQNDVVSHAMHFTLQSTRQTLTPPSCSAP